VAEKLKQEGRHEINEQEVMEELEDDEGNVYNRKTYDDLKKQGLIWPSTYTWWSSSSGEFCTCLGSEPVYTIYEPSVYPLSVCFVAGLLGGGGAGRLLGAWTGAMGVCNVSAWV